MIDADGKITTTSAGEYNFTLDLSGDHIYMYTEYPLNVGDYRVVLNNGTKNHPSGKIIRAKAESVTDTVSFFINKDAASRSLKVSCFKKSYCRRICTYSVIVPVTKPHGSVKTCISALSCRNYLKFCRYEIFFLDSVQIV